MHSTIPGAVRHPIRRERYLPDDLRQHGAGGANHDPGDALV